MGATAVVLVMAMPGLAQAATRAAAATGTQAPRLPYKIGAYTGTIDQKSPTAKGKIAFVVRHQAITALTFTVGVVCQALKVTDTDLLKRFHARVTHKGSFSYSGTMMGRHIRLRGKLQAGRATGTFFQSFDSGSLHCSMSQPASFTADR